MSRVAVGRRDVDAAAVDRFRHRRRRVRAGARSGRGSRRARLGPLLGMWITTKTAAARSPRQPGRQVLEYFEGAGGSPDRHDVVSRARCSLRHSRLPPPCAHGAGLNSKWRRLRFLPRAGAKRSYQPYDARGCVGARGSCRAGYDRLCPVRSVRAVDEGGECPDVDRLRDETSGNPAATTRVLIAGAGVGR